jgi:DNA (cytosine-5)-methyltransferase 1
MRYGSVCSGIEAATVAWEQLGWEAAFFSEIEAFPSAVLAHHYPNVTNVGDMTGIKHNVRSNIDVLVGGTPCQSFSVAGLRKGMADPRGNLALEFLAIADHERPEWVVWENVPGVLSSNGGKDFGSFLGGLGQLGYGFAYRVLDAQYFGVAQRRRRVFVVGCLGGWQRAAAVLFERESLFGDTPPSREKGEGIASFTPSSIGGYREGCGTLRAHGGDVGPGSENLVPETVGPITAGISKGPRGTEAIESNQLIPETSSKLKWPADTTCTINTKFGEKMGLEDQHALNGASMFVPIVMSSGQGNGEILKNVSSTLTCLHEAPIAFHSEATSCDISSAGENVSPTMRATAPPAAAVNTALPINTQIATRHKAMGEGTGMGIGDDGDPAYTLQAAHSHAVAIPINDKHAVAFTQNQRDEVREVEVPGALSSQPGMKQQTLTAEDVAPTLTTNDPSRSPQSAEVTRQIEAVHRSSMSVRRLTPTECERLQGFPDGYTAIPYRKKTADKCPDGPRYKALGNSMAVPVMAWIGKRIQEVSDNEKD